MAYRHLPTASIVLHVNALQCAQIVPILRQFLSIIFLVKSFWATFTDIWRFFSGHVVHALPLGPPPRPSLHNLCLFPISIRHQMGFHQMLSTFAIFSQTNYHHPSKEESSHQVTGNWLQFRNNDFYPMMTNEQTPESLSACHSIFSLRSYAHI